MKTYELIEHTADIGIRVQGKDLKELFANAAEAIFDIIAEKSTKSPPEETIEIRQSAEDTEELFINWLNELLSLSSAKELIFSKFLIKKIDRNRLEAAVIGSPMEGYKVNVEVKAATYHQLKLQESESGWQAEVILDV